MIVCFEGINGAGKTTLAKSVIERWRIASGRNAFRIEPMRHTEFGRRVREAIMNTPDLDVIAETLAFASARLHSAANLLPSGADESADLVIAERWAGAVVAYGAAAGTEPPLLHVLESLLTASARIDRTVLVDVPGAVAAARLARQTDRNRFETAGAEYLEDVRQNYLAWSNARSVALVDGMWPSDTVSTWIDGFVDSLLTTQRLPQGEVASP